MATPEEFKAHGEGYLFDHLGMTFAFSSSGEATGLLELEKHHFSWKDRVHAGTLFALADSCAGFGCIRSLPEGATGFATLETKTNFVATTEQFRYLVAEQEISIPSNRIVVLSGCESAQRSIHRDTFMVRCPFHPAHTVFRDLIDQDKVPLSMATLGSQVWNLGTAVQAPGT